MNKESMYDKLTTYYKDDYYPFHMPGHKRNSELISMTDPYEIDITEIDGFDNLHHPTDIILDIMNRISRIYGSQKSYILVNGSTCGILTAISAVTTPKDEILIARNCHKSVYNAVFIRQLKPDYISPKLNEAGIFGDISPEDVLEKLNQNENIKAVVITSPTYEGIVSDIEEIARVVHKKGAVLIVDEAHGAHFSLDEYFPKSAIEKGADIVIQSVHKTLPAMTQTAVMHVGGHKVNLGKVERFLGIYESSSPSYVLMSSVDKCFKLIEEKGTTLFREYVKIIENFYREAKKFKNIILFTPERVFDFDKGKLVIISLYEEFTGNDLYKLLLNKYHLQPEMASERYVVLMTSLCDTYEGFRRLINALSDIDKMLEGRGGLQIEEETFKFSRDGKIPERAFFSHETELYKLEEINLKKSVGRIAGDYVYLYPPGCPILVPGEIISENIVDKIYISIKRGLNVIGMEEDKIAVIK